MSTSKNATLKAIINAIITELMVRTTGDQVYLNDTTTVSAKIAEMVAAINLRAKSADVNNQVNALLTEINLRAKSADVANQVSSLTSEINLRAKTSDVDSQIDILNAAIALRATTDELTKQIDALRQEMLGDVPVEAYNTFTELAACIEAHEDVAEALTKAIGEKADKDTVETIQTAINELGTLAKKNSVSESDLDASLKAKVNSAADSSTVENIQNTVDNLGALAAKDKVSESDLDDSVVAKLNQTGDSESSHTHSNMDVLNGITSDDIDNWNNKPDFTVTDSEPANLTETGLWFCTI